MYELYLKDFFFFFLGVQVQLDFKVTVMCELCLKENLAVCCSSLIGFHGHSYV